uniref:Major capsid protein n=1 Tax=Megaviridae environmental sample TaxID=1737588 RepID=A0A5J6VM06_9VIRU|nr:MAG: major capsid protein [Megaviridae environmental sample]
MRGSLLQLISYGQENVHLNLDPHISLFKNVFKKHNQFAIDTVQFTVSKHADFNKVVETIIPKRGDYLNKIYLEVTLPYDEQSTDSFWTKSVGYNLIDELELYVDNILIDRQTGQFMYIYNNINNNYEKNKILDSLVGSTSLSSSEEQKIVIPFNFYFCNHYNGSFPIMALRDKNMKLKISFNKIEDCHQSGTVPTGKLTNLNLYCDYVLVDDIERKMLVQEDHEIIFQTTQHLKKEVPSNLKKKIQLNFTLPTKEYIVVIKSSTNQGDKFTNFTDQNNLNLLKTLQIKIDDNDIYSDTDKDSEYFNLLYPYLYHKGSVDNGINVIPFCLYPDELQVSGILNLRVLEKTQNLFIKSNETGTMDIYSICYNILTIKNGIVELKYLY